MINMDQSRRLAPAVNDVTRPSSRLPRTAPLKTLTGFLALQWKASAAPLPQMEESTREWCAGCGRSQAECRCW